jgi:hypothetical protein
VRVATREGVLEVTGTTLRLASGHHVVTAAFAKETS